MNFNNGTDGEQSPRSDVERGQGVVTLLTEHPLYSKIATMFTGKLCKTDANTLVIKNIPIVTTVNITLIDNNLHLRTKNKKKEIDLKINTLEDIGLFLLWLVLKIDAQEQAKYDEVLEFLKEEEFLVRQYSYSSSAQAQSKLDKVNFDSKFN